MIRTILLGVVTVCMAGASVRAAEPAEPAERPAPSPEVMASVPQPGCEQPKIPQRASMPVEDVSYFFDKAQTYTECMSRYIEERQAEMRKYNDLARAHAEAGNTAARAINEYQVQAKEFMNKHVPKNR